MLRPTALIAALALAATPLVRAAPIDPPVARDAARAPATGATAAPARDDSVAQRGAATPATRTPRAHEPTQNQQAGLKAARRATGAAYAHAEQQDHMPVPQTGM